MKQPKSDDKLMKELDKQVKEWRERFKKTGVPDCIECKTPMTMAYDSILKKRSKYMWEFQCDCHPKKIRLCMLGEKEE